MPTMMNALEKYRQEEKLTYKELSIKLNQSQPNIFKTCTGRVNMSGEVALRAHLWLGIPLKKLRPDLFKSNNQKNEGV